MKYFKTWLASLLTLTMAVSAGTLSVSGASVDFADCQDNGVNVIKKATATVDGVLDAAYTQSLILGDLGRAANAYGTEWPGTAEADIYLLHDEDYLYICAVVEDDDVLTKGYTFANGTNPWRNDCIEFRLCLDGINTVKVSIDAFGYNCFGLAEHYALLDYDSIKYATTRTSTGYTVEAAIPAVGDSYDLNDESSIGFTYQLNDLDSKGVTYDYTSSFNGEDVKVPVFYALSDSSAYVFTDCEDNGVNTVEIGTPIIDGKLDSNYKNSLVLGDLGRAANAYGTEWPGTAEADIYFLHDRDYLYICAVVEDDDVRTKGVAYAIGDNPYKNDCIEFRLSFDGSYSTVKVSIDAFGYNCFGLTDHYDKLDYDSIIYATTRTSTGYIVEAAIPAVGNYYDLNDESMFGFTYQLNDIDDYGTHYNHTTSFNGEAEKVPVFYNLTAYSAAVFTDCQDNGVDTIKKGTASVDGVLDAAYKQSLILGDLGRAKNAYPDPWSGTAEADVYFLYDEEYLYICAVVEDDDVLSKGRSYATGENPWRNDCIEFRLSLDGTLNTVKTSIDAYGYNCFGLTEHYDRLDYDSVIYATTYTDTKYIVEAAIPVKGDAYDLISEGKLGFTYQLNDLEPDGITYNHTTSFAGEDVKVPVFYMLDTAESSVISVSSANAAPGGTVKVNVSLENNPGVAAMRIALDYDSDVFTLQSVEDGGLLGNHTHSNNNSAVPYTLLWYNGSATENFEADGVIATLTFLVAEDAPEGEYEFNISYMADDILDAVLEPVYFSLSGGRVKIAEVVMGDASGDGSVGVADLMCVARYIAKWSGYDDNNVQISALDLNCDGKVNSIDMIILARHLAKWTGYENLPYTE